ncbi:MAG: hypothetical protein V3U76_00210 [Granulosicoccus sp.]
MNRTIPDFLRRSRLLVWLPILTLLFSEQLPAAGLTADERAIAASIADTTPWSIRHRQSRSNRRSQPHVLDVQTLSIEHDKRKTSRAVRRARVYQYDHNNQVARLVIVDFDQQSSLTTLPLLSIHLPLNAAEQRWALQQLSNELTLMENLRNEQRARHLTPFASLADLDVKASIFEPVDSQHICARQRCALLSLFDATRTVFKLEPVVNFATGNIILVK